MGQIHERVPFRVLKCSNCHMTICWVNPHPPRFCPGCSHEYAGDYPLAVRFSDDNAVLTINDADKHSGLFPRRVPSPFKEDVNLWEGPTIDVSTAGT